MQERKPHKWAEVIKAWADGKTVQVKGGIFYPEWTDYPELDISPNFNSPVFAWRVKPENIVIEGEITRNPYLNNGCFSIKTGNNNNIRLEFDPDSYKLVKAEVIG